MKHMEFTGKTLEEAVQNALEQLDVQKKDLTWETLEPTDDNVRIRVILNKAAQTDNVEVPPAPPVEPGEPPQKPFISDIPVPADSLKVDEKPEE